jgi:autotransporter-associated beta strand protein
MHMPTNSTPRTSQRAALGASTLSIFLAFASSLSAATYTWDNGANTNLWGNSTNWVGDPAPLTFNNTTDIVFDNASVVNRTNTLSIGGARTVRSITIGANYATSNNLTFDIQTSNTINTGSANLTFSANSGNASITVAQSTSGAVQTRLGRDTGGFLVLSSNLDVIQNNTFYNTVGLLFEGRLTGSGSINKTGAGLVRLQRNNSLWTGNMNINEGAVTVGNDGNNVFGQGTWTLGGGANNTSLIVRKFFEDRVAPAPGGIVVAAGAGTRTIANHSSGNGSETGLPNLSGNITLNKDAIFNVQDLGTGNNTMTLSGNVTGTGGIAKTNTGILSLSGTNNNYSGTTDIQAGKLSLGGAGRLGSGNVTISSGANLDFSTGASQINNVANNISGAGEIFQNLASTDTRITGDVTNTGGLNINAGTFRIGNATTTGSYSGNATVASGATLAFSRSNAYAHGGTISGAGGVSKVEAGDVTLTGNNSYSGTTALFTAALVADHANALGTGNITFNNLGGNTGTIRYTANSSATDWATRIVNSTGTIRLDTNGNDVNLAGAINNTNANGLTKSGAGTLTLGGANTYIGSTTVSAGTLAVNGSVAGAMSVASGATLQGNGTISGNTTVSGNLKPGNSPGLLTFANSLTLDSSAVTTMEITGANSSGTRGTTYDAVNVTNALNYGGTLALNFDTLFTQTGNYTFNLFDFNSTSGSFGSVSLAGVYSGSFTNNSGIWGLTDGDNNWSFNQGDGVLTFTVVPEPNVAMVAGSLVLMAMLRRRRD